MEKYIYAFTIVLLSVAVRVNSLQCYQCLECTQVNETHLVTCGGGSTTTPTPSTATTSGGSNSTNSSSTPVPPTNGTNATNNKYFEVRRFKREVFDAVDTRDVAYVCATVKGTVNGTEVVGRGCLPDLGDDAKTCAPANETGKLTSCVTCNIDKCNSAVSLQFTSALLFVAACFFVKS